MARAVPHEERRRVERGDRDGAGVSSSNSPHISSATAVRARRERDSLRREEGEVRFEEGDGDGEGDGRRMCFGLIAEGVEVVP